MSIKGFLSNLSISTQIKVFNLAIGLVFILILAVMTLSLSYAHRVLVNNISEDIETVVANSQVSRDLALLFSDSNLLFNTFHGRADYLQKEGNRLLAMTRAISRHSSCPELRQAILDLADRLGAAFSSCEELNSILHEKNNLENAILQELDTLDEIIAEQTVNRAFAGKDTSFLEQLSVRVVDYRYSLFKIGKHFAEVYAGSLMAGETENQTLFAEIDDLLLRLSVITASVRQTFEHGKQLIRYVKQYRQVISRYCDAMERFRAEVGDFNMAKSRSIEFLRDTDTNIINTTRITSRKITKFFLGTWASVFLISFLVMGVLLLVTSYFLRSTINRPMERLRKTLTSFSQGDFTARVRMKRSGEWSLIEKVLNEMADDILTSHQALRQSEEKYREIFNTPSDAILMHDADTGEIIDVNQAMLDMFGYSYDEALQQDIGTISSGEPPYTLEEAVKKFSDAKKQGPQLFEWRSRRKNGELFWAEIGLKYRMFSGKHYVVAIVRDISSRKEAEQALARKQEQLSVTLRSIGDGVITTDTDGRITLINKVAEKLTGWTQAEAVGRFLEEVFHIIDEKTGERAENPVEKVLSTGNIIALADNTALVARDGSKINIADSGAPIRDDEGRIIGVVMVFRDITHELASKAERLKLESQIRQAHKMEAIGTLAGGIAHDFNNILTIILGYADMAKEDAPPGSKLAQDLDQVLQAGYRAKALVQQILAFSRQAQVEKIPLQPQPIIKEALKMLRSSIPTTIDIQESISSDCGVIDADPTQLHQILMNLCTNAFHAMEEKGGVLKVGLKVADTVPLELRKGKSGAEKVFLDLSISDTGQGMSPEVIDKIFDPFFTTKEKGKGTGMGLAITYGIVKEYGGAITVDSQPGKGTTFHIYLPQGEPATTHRPSEESVVSKGRERILFVDDEKFMADLGKDMLERLGYHVTAMQKSLEALEIFKKQPYEFDLVITDQNMPGMSGLDLAKSMLQIRPDIPIILCTGYSTLVNERVAKSRGIKGFALKPLTKSAIAKLIRQMLDGEDSTA